MWGKRGETNTCYRPSYYSCYFYYNNNIREGCVLIILCCRAWVPASRSGLLAVLHFAQQKFCWSRLMVTKLTNLCSLQVIFSVSFDIPKGTCTITWSFLSHSLCHDGHARPLTDMKFKPLPRMTSAQVKAVKEAVGDSINHRYIFHLCSVPLPLLNFCSQSLAKVQGLFKENVFLTHKQGQNLRSFQLKLFLCLRI